MKFSLIMATLGRSKEVKELLDSLSLQQYNNFELIIVDQNIDDRIKTILKSCPKKINYNYYFSEKGLSKARNVGLEKATGDILAFPDDDCIYPPDLLFRINLFFRKNPMWDGLSGRPITFEGQTSFGNFDNKSGKITKKNIWKRVNSNTLFLRRKAVSSVDGFDEELGIGSGTLWGAGEDVDYPLRVLSKGYKIYYDPNLTVFHPKHLITNDSIKKAYLYAAGMGRVMRIHKYPYWYVFYYFLRPLGGIFLSSIQLKPSKAKYYWWVLKGRIAGWSWNFSKGI